MMKHLAGYFPKRGNDYYYTYKRPLDGNTDEIPITPCWVYPPVLALLSISRPATKSPLDDEATPSLYRIIDTATREPWHSVLGKPIPDITTSIHQFRGG